MQMQPNQPDSNQQNTVTTTGANIPEYLHMDPISTDALQRRGYKKFFVILILSFIFAALVTGYLLIQSSGSPQERLYGALEKQMQTVYLSRVYDINLINLGSNARVVVESDYSDSTTPKSHIKYENKQSLVSTSGEDTILNNQEYYSKLLSRKPVLPDVEIDQWYRVPFSAANSREVTYNFSDFDSRLAINSTQGLVLTGNFNETTRAKLMDYIRTNGVYTIINSDDQELVDGSRATTYSLAINRTALNALNKYTASLLGSTQLFTVSTTVNANEELKVTVDNKSGRLTRVSYAVGSNKSSPNFKKTIIYTHPSRLQIKKPDNIKELPNAKAS